ncbi:MAG: bifunctional folylpolyglutamate synthase/dihydrofolate synthase [Rubrivivax sp.]|nr:bifunctional folylpolyglutamate synthase/dihydrofolate synthase [Rubrivivax sp.]MBP6463505.1 bifunctional folylpolyglutamate synthase/dihydrofolate synthase [Rubrivivax sp.]MBP9908825.1 bifunctional folylpolyglutamate synthase/dihydrofolate synthase [Rubrivivax sp.]HRC39044.1 folylpolyglutamate synthase/dihydrofolate synthase family protein [Rubrivivax sp.]
MTTPTTLPDWLAHCARLHPKTMDLSLERTVEVARRLGIAFAVPVITVAGTNGKGSTCAMIESIARHAGYRTGLYQKPELVHFEERCRIGGEPVAAAALLPHFAAVEQARLSPQAQASPPPEGASPAWGGPALAGEIALTQFEFSTLAIARLLSLAALDLVILEVGLGGRFDSVNAFDTDCAVITSIALDHMEYLGTDREAIGLEKAQVMRPGKPAIVSDPLPPASVVAHAAAIGADLWLVGRDFNHRGDRQQWAWSGRGRRYHALSYPALRGANQLLNAAGAIAALEALRDRLPISAQAIRNGLAMVELPGRFQIVPGQPALVLDVAHNPQAVAALAVNLDAMGFFPRTHAVFGAMRDKDIPELLAKMAPLVDVWHCCELPTARAATAAELAAQVQAALAGRRGAPVPVYTHPSPADALRQAAAAADPADRIVVFGSFYTVGGVLKEGLPRLSAPHLG